MNFVWVIWFTAGVWIWCGEVNKMAYVVKLNIWWKITILWLVWNAWMCVCVCNFSCFSYIYIKSSISMLKIHWKSIWSYTWKWRSPQSLIRKRLWAYHLKIRHVRHRYNQVSMPLSRTHLPCLSQFISTKVILIISLGLSWFNQLCCSFPISFGCLW